MGVWSTTVLGRNRHRCDGQDHIDHGQIPTTDEPDLCQKTPSNGQGPVVPGRLRCSQCLALPLNRTKKYVMDVVQNLAHQTGMPPNASGQMLRAEAGHRLGRIGGRCDGVWEGRIGVG